MAGSDKSTRKRADINMCKLCALVLNKLVKKGLVSEGNVGMCVQEIEKDLEKMVTSTNPTELDMIIRHDRSKGGYDA